MLSQQFKPALDELARSGIFIGTSSWKYPGWCGQLYDEQRYLTRNKFSEAKFERECLSEYAQTFSSVCVDAGYYKFLSEKWIEGLCSQVTLGFRFFFKVTDAITIKNFLNHTRHGILAGKANEHFLNAKLFRSSFLLPCEPFHDHIGALIFEFSQFHQRDFEHGRQFLGGLPSGWQYGVEIRNKNFLQPEYFDVLHRHGVAHVFNSWTRLPPVIEQLALPDSVTTDFLVGRFLLAPGRTYEQALNSFSPYKDTQALDPVAREAGKAIIVKAKGNKRSFT